MVIFRREKLFFRNSGVNMDNLEDIENQLRNFLKEASSLVILGIGNDIRGDDGLGPYIIEELSLKKEEFQEASKEIDALFDLNDLFLINGGSVPENFTSKIKSYDPSHIILIDASLMGREPGDIEIVNKENISNISISTHSMSLAYLIKFLELEKPFEILFIGIEPEIMDLSFELSDTVKKASDDLVEILFSVILNE